MRPRSQQVLEFVNEHESSGIDIRQIDVEQLKEAREILKNRLKEGISIKELSRKVGLNQNKLKHGFKRVFGHTINAYLLKLRLDKARLLIASNNSSLKEVAEEVGYANKSFFARKFKERYGVLPREFKKELEA